MSDRIPGSSWTNPIIYRDVWRIIVGDFIGYDYIHTDYDGAPDSNDNRGGNCPTIEACKAEIDERFYDE